MKLRHSILLLFGIMVPGSALVPAVATPGYDFVVAADGSGNFTSIQEAIDAVPHLRKNRTTIYIRNGLYKEKLILPSTKTNVTFLGESPTETIITYDDYASRENIFGEEIGTSGSSGFYIFGDGFIARNITFSNTAGPVGQAVAVRVDGDMVMFENCRFLGFQDTLYPHGEDSRQYYRNCYIEGTVDFIFGWSTAVFEECRITGDAPEHSFYLGRPWRPYSKVAFIECELGSHIKPEGWHNWNKPDAEQTAFYAEYKNFGAGADISGRVPWAHQLSDEEAERYTPGNILGEWIGEHISQ